MARHRFDSGGMLIAGMFVGIVLAILNNSLLSLTVTIYGFRLHHLWVGLALTVIGTLTKITFLIGLGALLMVDDLIRHQTPTGLLPFW